MVRRGAGGTGEKCQPSGLSAEGGNDSEFRQTTSGAHGSASRADCLPRGKPHACDGIRQLCRMRTPAGGMTRRLRRGSGTYCPMRRSHFSFGGERKVCKRKPAARRLREKALDCPFWRRGSQCRAQWSWIAFTNCWSALVLAFFRRQSGRAFFPPLPIAALLRRRLGGGRGRIARVGKFRQDLADLAALISNEEI